MPDDRYAPPEAPLVDEMALIGEADGEFEIGRALSDAWSAYGHGTFETLVRQTELYREALREAGKSFPPERFRLSKELYVGRTNERDPGAPVLEDVEIPRVTPAGVAKLKRALPDLQVLYFSEESGAAVGVRRPARVPDRAAAALLKSVSHCLWR